MLPNDYEAYVNRHIGETPLADLSYAQLTQAAEELLRQVTQDVKIDTNESASRDELRKARAFLDRRGYGGLRRLVGARTPMETALLEVFISARVRRCVLAYLSIQEASNFEEPRDPDNRFASCISEVLGLVGRGTWCGIVLRVAGFSWRLPLDPLSDLRAMYARHLSNTRRGRSPSTREASLIACHRLLFRAKALGVSALVRRICRQASSRSGPERVILLMKRHDVRRAICMAMMLLCPMAKELSRKEWEDLYDRLIGYAAIRVPALLRAMTSQSLETNGVVKLIKVAVGTIVGRVSTYKPHVDNAGDFIFDTLRIAFSWGATYPLVDDVIDCPTTTPLQREHLVRVLRAAITERYDERDESDGGTVLEIGERIVEVMSIVPKHRRPGVRQAILLLVEAHRRDSARALVRGQYMEPVASEVWVDSILKAGLVRVATMAVCGISVDGRTIAKGLVRGMFNQLGDDLWDVGEDLRSCRVTPFTLAFGESSCLDPYLAYRLCAMAVSADQGVVRRRAAMCGYLECMRDSLSGLGGSTSAEESHVAKRIRCEAESVVGERYPDLFSGVPHVDLDAVIFMCGRAVRHVVSRSCSRPSDG